MCSFWKFEAIRTHCRGVSLVVRNFQESDREEAIQLARFVAEGLSKPCHFVSLVAQHNISQPGFARSKDHAALRSDLGCGGKQFFYRVRVQVRASTFVADRSGAGHFTNRHIYTHSVQGEIQ